MTRSFSAMVVGAGAWGTAIASVFARGGNETLLWDRDEGTINSIQCSGSHPKFFEGTLYILTGMIVFGVIVQV